MKASRAILLVLFFGILPCLPGAAKAAPQYPSRPITFIIPYPPGGNAEMCLRPLLEYAGKELETNFVVTPMPGAAAMTGLSKALSAKPDGYTLFGGAYSNFTITAQLRKLRFTWETPEYLATVAASTPYFGVAKDKNHFTTFDGFVAYAKTNPGKLNVAQIGTTGIHQVMSLQLMKKLGISFQTVPYDGGPPTVAAALGGHADALYTDNYNPALHQIFLLSNPSEHYPGLQTLTDLGHGDIAMGIYYIIGAPKGTPKEVLKKLGDVFAKGVQTPEFKERLKTLRWDAIWRNGAETRAAIQKEAASVRALIDEGLLKRID